MAHAGGTRRQQYGPGTAVQRCGAAASRHVAYGRVGPPARGAAPGMDRPVRPRSREDGPATPLGRQGLTGAQGPTGAHASGVPAGAAMGGAAGPGCAGAAPVRPICDCATASLNCSGNKAMRNVTGKGIRKVPFGNVAARGQTRRSQRKGRSLSKRGERVSSCSRVDHRWLFPGAHVWRVPECARASVSDYVPVSNPHTCTTTTVTLSCAQREGCMASATRPCGDGGARVAAILGQGARSTQQRLSW
jgi:hypothetical protein